LFPKWKLDKVDRVGYGSPVALENLIVCGLEAIDALAWPEVYPEEKLESRNGIGRCSATIRSYSGPLKLKVLSQPHSTRFLAAPGISGKLPGSSILLSAATRLGLHPVPMGCAAR
jgi:hypothetical protein